MMSTDIIEGFLCPICKKDLGTVTQLQGHFEEHSIEDRAVFHQLKGFFDKAKKKILGDKVETELTPTGEPAKKDEAGGLSGYDPAWWEDQEIGQVKSHTDGFKSVRDARVNHFVVETNKLLIRLDKLVGPEAPTDPKKKRGFEKSVVRWIPDSEVPACLNCLCSFGLLTRRHHCRLCGGVMCNACSEFMSSSYAQTLVNPAHGFSGEGFLKRTSSNSSLNSLVGANGEPVMRVCKTCRRLLERRDSMTKLRNTRPPIVQIYDKLKMCMKEADLVLPDYTAMVESLSQGETVHSYTQAQILRAKLVKLYEVIDQLSKQIGVLNQDQTLSDKQAYIQNSVRLYASNFMQDKFMGLQTLPTEDEYAKLRQARAAEIQRKIAAERQAAMEAQERERQERERIARELLREEGHHPEDSPKHGQRQGASGADVHTKLPTGKVAASINSKANTRNEPDSSMGKGWKPAEEAVKTSRAMHPLLQQIEIIRGYISQAKEAHRTEEVLMLEQNLRDLYNEYLRQQQHQKEH